KAGRDPNSVALVAVTKYAKQEQVLELLKSGLIREVAESRVQDAQARKSGLGEMAKGVAWRLIGHLQSNKAKKALEVFDAVDSLDRLKLAEALEKGLAGTDRRLPVLIQVKLSDQQTQSGVAPDEVAGLLAGL